MTLTHQKINYKSDFTLAVTFTIEGVVVDNPAGDFAIIFKTDPRGASYVCARSGGKYTNCRLVDDALVCIFDNHNLKPGFLCCEFHDLIADSLFESGRRSVVTPSITPVELVRGAAEGDDVTAEVVIDIEEAIHAADEAATSANEAASAANEAANDANNAAQRAEEAAAQLMNFGYLVVDELPQVGDRHYIYLVPSSDTGTQNVYDEWLWVGTPQGDIIHYAWELVGSTNIDLTDYYTKSQTDALVSPKYTLPTGGIPASDMSSAVQTSLGKADTALQGDYFPLIEDMRTSAVAAITGVAPFASLVDGQRILLHLKNNTASNATLELTLSSGLTTGAKKMKMLYRNAMVDIGTYYAFLTGSYIILIYNATAGYWVSPGRDTDTTYSTITQAEITDGTSTNTRVVTPKLLRDNFPIFRTVQDDSAVVGTLTLNATKYHDLGTIDTVNVELPTHDGGISISGSGGENGFAGLNDLMDDSDIPAADRPYITAIADGQVANGGAQASYPVTASVVNSLSGLFANEDFYDTYVGFANNQGKPNATMVIIPDYSRTDEFLFTFTCSTGSTELNLPNGVGYGNGLDFDADRKANRRFQVSISDGIALYAYVDPSNE